MIKKIALASIFAIASVISFNASNVNAGKSTSRTVPSMGAPVMAGLCPFGGGCR